MQLRIRTHHVDLPAATRREIQHRLARVFARIEPWIHAIDVAIADINGPRGGADKQCRVLIHARSGLEIVVEQRGDDAVATVAMAAERAAQALRRKTARLRESSDLAHAVASGA